ncbi:MAG: HD domain-containing protein [bacterium]
MNKKEIIEKTVEHVKKVLKKDSSGHDWWHVYRAWKMAIRIAEDEKNVDLFVVELAALLHDIADFKFHGGDLTIGPTKAREWLASLNVSSNVIDHVAKIISEISFKGARVATPMSTKEGMIVQDADRLDAIGAIGIARTFAFGGNKGNEMYNPAVKTQMHDSFEEYSKCNGTTINHFYEKLLLLKDLMNTKTGKQIAEQRHIFMQQYLDRFLNEWEGCE